MVPIARKVPFEGELLSWQSVYHHYRKWSKQGAWKACWVRLLSRYRKELDLSSSDLDGSHTTALRGGEQVGYQGRKKRKTTNVLLLSNRQGLPLAMSSPVSGNHNDLFEIGTHFEEVTHVLENANIVLDGLFLNADAGFDSKELREKCQRKGIIPNFAANKRKGRKDNNYLFDSELYKERCSIERTNAWMDSYRSLLNRFDTTLTSWIGFNYLAFIVIALKKFNKKKV